MNPAPLTSTIHNLLAVTERMAIGHGVEPQAVVLHSLALALAGTGNFITHQPTGLPTMPAKFSLLIRTPDREPPPWIGDEWLNVEQHQAAISKGEPGFLAAPANIASLRRQKRVLTALESSQARLEVSVIDARINFEKRRKTYPRLHLIEAGKCGPPPKQGAAGAVAAGGYHSLRRILRSRGNEAGLAALIDAPAVQRASLIGWTATSDWKRLKAEAGPDFLPKLGWIIEPPGSSFCGDQSPHLASAMILKKLDALHFAGIRAAFKPNEHVRALLDRHVGEIREMANRLPPEQREVALPDLCLAWHLAALVTQLCAGDKETEDHVKVLQAAHLGIMLSAWATRQHLHHYRHAFPADDAGPFVGQDLSIFRFLKPTPSPVRAFMRRLRGVNKDACLLSLRRAVDAGLALEPEAGRFAAIPAPVSKLSENRTDSSQTHAVTPEPAPDCTDNTDKSPAGPPTCNSPHQANSDHVATTTDH